MKKLIFLLLILVSCQEERTYNARVINYEGEEILIGDITVAGLQEEPFLDWYTYFYQDYAPNTTQLDQITDQLQSTKITVFLGTWCTDSQEQVPGFLRMLQYAGYDFKQLRIIALERKEDRSMVSPEGLEKELGITHVPTFIFYQSGRELGRIVEFPETTLEGDMKSILLD